MNIANSRALLLSLLVCLFVLPLSANHFIDGDKKETKKDLIIVNIDAELNNQIAGLAQYTYDLYLSHDKGLVSIKQYVAEGSNENKTIDSLVVLLKDLGVAESKILVSQEVLTLDQPYFTLSVSAAPEVQ